MNRYLVFSYSNYYPEGGMNDCCLKTSDESEAVRLAVMLRDEDFYHVHVYDVVEECYVALPERETTDG